MICKEILESNFDNTGVFDLGKPMFVMECLAHVLANSCKLGVMDVKSDNGQVYTEVTRNNMQRCIIWKERSHKGEKALEAAQNNSGLPSRMLVTPVKNRFAYLIHSLRSLLGNKPDINYLYVSMENITDKISERKPYLKDWSITITVVTTM